MTRNQTIEASASVLASEVGFIAKHPGPAAIFADYLAEELDRLGNQAGRPDRVTANHLIDALKLATHHGNKAILQERNARRDAAPVNPPVSEGNRVTVTGKARGYALVASSPEHSVRVELGEDLARSVAIRLLGGTP